jgi:hypothetical protein
MENGKEYSRRGLRVPEVARRWGCSESFVRKLILERRVPTIRKANGVKSLLLTLIEGHTIRAAWPARYGSITPVLSIM